MLINLNTSSSDWRRSSADKKSNKIGKMQVAAFYIISKLTGNLLEIRW